MKFKETKDIFYLSRSYYTEKLKRKTSRKNAERGDPWLNIQYYKLVDEEEKHKERNNEEDLQGERKREEIEETVEREEVQGTEVSVKKTGYNSRLVNDQYQDKHKERIHIPGGD